MDLKENNTLLWAGLYPPSDQQKKIAIILQKA